MARQLVISPDFEGARASRVADVLGEGVEEVLSKAADLGEQGLTPNAFISGPTVAELLRNVSPRRSLDDAEALLIEAFSVARGKKESWQTMLLSVLKNRLISITAGEFDETDFGTPAMTYFAAQFPELLQVSVNARNMNVATVIDESRIPAAGLLGLSTPPVPPADPRKRPRIRRDLWDAIMDYKSGRRYCWDAASGMAREIVPGEVGVVEIPTVEPEALEDWRGEVLNAAERMGLPEAEAALVKHWVTAGLGTNLLPPQLRSVWNAIQNDHVTQLIEDFFDRAGLPVPEDLHAVAVRHRGGETSLGQLRDFAKRCIDLMSEAELAELKIPTIVALRASER